MTPGAMLYQARRRLRHGLRGLYWREVIAPRILDTPPITGTDDATCEVHVLTSAGDWVHLVWALKTLYHFSRHRYALCIHEDGSLPEHGASALRRHFPNARLVRRPEADTRLEPLLRDAPLSRELRRTNHLSLKVFDFAAFLDSPRMFLFDSDILFFSKPTELLRRVEDPVYALNTLNRDWNYGYSCDRDVVQRLVEFEFQDRINSGLGLVHRGSVRVDWVEEFLGLPGVIGHPHRIEQTLIALCSCRYGYEMLSSSYDVRMGPTPTGAPCRHYTGPIRGLMYVEGINRLIRGGFLERVGR